MQKLKREPQINIRTPEQTKSRMKEIAAKKDRPLNYVINEALNQYIARNGEAPTTCDSQGF